METAIANRGARQKPSVRMLLRVSLCLAIGGCVIAVVSNLGLHINGDFLSEEVRGPHPLAGAVGEIAFRTGIFVIPCAMVLNFFGLPLSFFRAPIAANSLVALGGLLLGIVAWQISEDGITRVRANPVRRHAAEVAKLATLIDRYAKKHNGYLPASDNWCETLTEFNSNAARYLSCPMSQDVPPGFSTLALNARLEASGWPMYLTMLSFCSEHGRVRTRSEIIGYYLPMNAWERARLCYSPIFTSSLWESTDLTDCDGRC